MRMICKAGHHALVRGKDGIFWGMRMPVCILCFASFPLVWLTGQPPNFIHTGHFVEIRNATVDDALAIVAIYNHYVLNTTISFEESAVSASEMGQRIGAVLDAKLPWLVAINGKHVVGYAYATKWRQRHAYRHSVESSVYIAHQLQRSGLGTMLYTALLKRLGECGVHLVLGGIAQPNSASVALHEKMGYAKAAMFEEVGYKFGSWIDVGYWQVKLPANEGAPAAPP